MARIRRGRVLMGRDDPCHVLVLDDEPLILLDLEYAVHDAGCVPVTAMSCHEALNLVAERAITVAILDVTLGPDSTCEPVVRELAQRGIPYVLHTGDLDRLDQLARALGGELVRKPTPAHRVVEIALAHASLPVSRP